MARAGAKMEKGEELRAPSYHDEHWLARRSWLGARSSPCLQFQLGCRQAVVAGDLFLQFHTVLGFAEFFQPGDQGHHAVVKRLPRVRRRESQVLPAPGTMHAEDDLDARSSSR